MKNFTQKFKTASLCLLTFFSITIYSNAQETCATAVPVTDLTGVVCATGSPGSVDNLAAASCGSGTKEAFFSFVAQGPYADITVTSSVSGFRPEFVVMESDDNTCSGLFSYWAGNCFDQNGNYLTITNTATQLIPGNTYWVVISSGKTTEVTTGTLTVCINNPIVNPACVDNENCANAAPIVLPASNSGSVCTNDCNAGAAMGMDFIGNVCEDQLSPTVWYSYTTDALHATFDVNLTSSDFSTPKFTIWENNCSSLISVYCVTGTGGSASLNSFTGLNPNTTYLISVSDNNGGAGAFQLCIEQHADNSPCNTNSGIVEVSSTDPTTPSGGPYAPGESVRFRYTITDWQVGPTCNYLQGIVPSFGSGWDPTSFNVSGAPNTINLPLVAAGILGDDGVAVQTCLGTPSGTWGWFNAGAVNYNNLGGAGSLPDNTPMPAGWYFLSSYNPLTGSCSGDPTDPDNSYGDNDFPFCSSTLDWALEFTLTAGPYSNCSLGQTDLSVQMQTYADGEIGVWSSVGCVGNLPQTFPATLFCCQSPIITPVNDDEICSNSTTNINLTSNQDPSVTFTWSVVSGPNIAGASNGSGSNISQTLINNGSVPESVVYTVTGINGNCSATETFTITVQPVINVTNASLAQAICSGTSATFTPTSGVVGTTFAWTAVASAGTITGFSASGSGNISEIISNSATTSGTVTYTITPTGPAPTFCVGTPTNFVVTVNPIPTVTNLTLNQTICSGSNATFTPTSSVASTTFAWTASLTSGTVTGFSASGTGNISETLTNSTTAVGSVTYVITPTGPATTSCVGSPVNFVVTVNPLPSFTVAGVSPTTCNGTDGTITLSGLGNSLAYNVTYVNGVTSVGPTLLTSSPTGDILISGLSAGTYTPFTAQLVSSGCSKVVNTSISLTNPGAPNVFDITNVVQCAGTSYTLTAINGTTLSGSEAYYDAPGNTGNLIPVGTVFTTDTTIYIYDESGICNDQEVFTITFNPRPTVTNVLLAQAICSGSSATFTPTSGVASSTFAWTASLTSGTITGFSASGTGNISEVLTNSTTTAGTVRYIITPTGPATTSCVGSSVNFDVTVNPIPTVTNATLIQAICSGSSATFTPTSGVASSTFAWTASLTSGTITGFSASGTGNISEVLTNLTTTAGTVRYIIAPTGPATTSCVGSPVNFDVTVNPIPTVTNALLAQAICSGSSATFTPTSGVASSTFAWTASLTSGTVTGFSTSGIGNISEVLTNTTTTAGTVRYVITPTGPATTSCVGTPVSFDVNVNPLGNPAFTFADYCQDAVNAPIITGDLGGTFSFNPAVTDGATINAATGVIQNGVGGTQYTVNYVVNCLASSDVNVTVNPIPNAPTVSGVPTSSLCSNAPLSVLLVTGNGGTFTWLDHNNLTVSITNSYSPLAILGVSQYEVFETFNGCDGPSTLISIDYIKCDIFVPTAFTPDNNNVDDIWELKDIDVIFPNNEVSIYNRWGALLFKSEKGKYETKPWDGKFNGEELPVASYYFIIEYNDDNMKNSTGTVSIIRK